MNVGRREPSGLNKRIKALDAQRGAAEAKRCLGRRNKSRDLEESHLDWTNVDMLSVKGKTPGGKRRTAIILCSRLIVLHIFKTCRDAK
jgi:hypothetical protein